MSAKIISMRRKITNYWYEKEFRSKITDVWYGYKCDKDGNVFMDELHPNAIKIYNDLLNNKDWKVSIVKRSHSYTKDAVAECPYCHRQFQLWNEYLGACKCECGQWYSLSGEELINPELWEEEWWEV